MAWSLRLVEHRLETGALRLFAKGPRVLFVRAGTIRLVSPGHAEGTAAVGQDAAVFSAGACGVQSYRNALSFLAFELVRQPSPPAGGRVLLEHPHRPRPKGCLAHAVRSRGLRAGRRGPAPWPSRRRHSLPPAGIAHRDGGRRAGASHAAGDCWFESGREPVLAQASATEETSFVRCAILPVEIRGQTSILYVIPRTPRAAGRGRILSSSTSPSRHEQARAYARGAVRGPWTIPRSPSGITSASSTRPPSAWRSAHLDFFDAYDLTGSS